MDINSTSNIYNNFDASSVSKYQSGNAVGKIELKWDDSEPNVNKDAFTPSLPNENNHTEPSLSIKSADILKAVQNAPEEAPEAGEPGTADEGEPAFDITFAGMYDDGSDVKELAYSLAREGDRDDVNLGDYGVLKANDGDNVIKISQNEQGMLVVDVDGEEAYFSPEEAKRLIIDGGGGNDRIIADKSVTMDLHIVGGRGDDHIETGRGNDFIIDNYGGNYIAAGAGDDRIIANQLDFTPGAPARTVQVSDSRSPLSKAIDGIKGREAAAEVSVNGNYIDGGDGADYIEGGKGDDYIVGGKGNDVIYGLDGSDTILGGDGRDYLDGGRGDDTIIAGAGNDMIMGGSGDDTIQAGSGKNVIVGGRGRDTIDGGSGHNRITSDGSDTISGGRNSVETVAPMEVPGNISIGGTDEGYRMRVQSDLDVLAATSTGQKMLNGLADMKGHKVEIASTDGGNYCSYYTTGILKDDGTANEGSDSTVAYNRFRIKIGRESWGERSPIVGMYHEMAHSYDAGNGILDSRRYNYDGTLAAGTDEDPGEVKGAELQAVGIDTGAKEITLNPDGISENSLREFLGLEQRPYY